MLTHPVNSSIYRRKIVFKSSTRLFLHDRDNAQYTILIVEQLVIVNLTVMWYVTWLRWHHCSIVAWYIMGPCPGSADLAWQMSLQLLLISQLLLLQLCWLQHYCEYQMWKQLKLKLKSISLIKDCSFSVQHSIDCSHTFIWFNILGSLLW